MQFAGPALPKDTSIAATAGAVIGDTVENKVLVIKLKPEGAKAESLLMMHVTEGLVLISQVAAAIYDCEMRD
jgi:hypothetical protein